MSGERKVEKKPILGLDEYIKALQKHPKKIFKDYTREEFEDTHKWYVKSNEDHADDVLGLITSLNLSSPILVGHSMGGMTATVVASRNPKLLTLKFTTIDLSSTLIPCAIILLAD